MIPNKSDKKPGKFLELIDAIFPTRYDFEDMLAEQAERTHEGVKALTDWLDHHAGEEPVVLSRLEDEVDAFRYSLEEKLGDSFSTPFDRQDIYSLSRRMDYILNFSYETAHEMYLFGVPPEPLTRDMAGALGRGTGHLARGVRAISSDGKQVLDAIRQARREYHALDDLYLQAMRELFSTPLSMDVLKKREIYHHLRDGGRALQETVDILHTVVVGIELGEG
jgi:uncharacterized protein Yka (UPF0111/DUF47 family)